MTERSELLLPKVQLDTIRDNLVKIIQQETPDEARTPLIAHMRSLSVPQLMGSLVVVRLLSIEADKQNMEFRHPSRKAMAILRERENKRRREFSQKMGISRAPQTIKEAMSIIGKINNLVETEGYPDEVSSRPWQAENPHLMEFIDGSLPGALSFIFLPYEVGAMQAGAFASYEACRIEAEEAKS